MRGSNGGWPSTLRVAAGNRRKIKLSLHQRHDQPRQVVLGHVVLHARRQKLRLIDLPGAKILAHNPARNRTRHHLTSDYSDRLLEAARPAMKAGDRVWVWLDEKPSTFEMQLAEGLLRFPKSDRGEGDNGVFHVKIYSWRGDAEFTRQFLKTSLPKVELPFPRLIGFLRVDDELELSIPLPTLSFPHSAQAGGIHIHARKFRFHDETLMTLASRQVDHDREGDTLAGAFDALGVISLLSGRILHHTELLSSYFCTTSEEISQRRTRDCRRVPTGLDTNQVRSG